jgi:hypothetical protein
MTAEGIGKTETERAPKSDPGGRCVMSASPGNRSTAIGETDGQG